MSEKGCPLKEDAISMTALGHPLARGGPSCMTTADVDAFAFSLAIFAARSSSGNVRFITPARCQTKWHFSAIGKARQ